MQSYGVPSSAEGMLPWEWACDLLSKSHNYLLATVKPDGAPHVMPIWGIWLDGAFYFSTSATSRKGRNLKENPKCVVCNDDVKRAVIVEGEARKLAPAKVSPQAFVAYKKKYQWDLDPKLGPIFRVDPKVVFAMPEKQFPKGVTKWVFSKKA